MKIFPEVNGIPTTIDGENFKANLYFYEPFGTVRIFDCDNRDARIKWNRPGTPTILILEELKPWESEAFENNVPSQDYPDEICVYCLETLNEPQGFEITQPDFLDEHMMKFPCEKNICFTHCVF